MSLFAAHENETSYLKLNRFIDNMHLLRTQFKSIVYINPTEIKRNFGFHVTRNVFIICKNKKESNRVCWIH